MTTWAQYAARQDSQKIYIAEITTLDSADVEQTLRVSTGPIDPALTDYPYLPLLASGAIPAYSTSTQEVLQGHSQDGFGALALTLLDGRLDDRLENHRWAGREVSLKMGFAGLAVSDYKLLFYGHQQRAEYDDHTLNIPIMSPKLAVVRLLRASGTYTDTVPNLVSALLTLAGVTNIDSTAWTAWAAQNNFAATYTLTNPTSVGTLLDQLLGRIGCFWRFKRDGQFTLGTFTAPNPLSTADLAINTAIHGVGKTNAVKIKRLDRYWRVRVQYNPASPATVSQQDATILTEDPLALDGAATETYLTSVTDANTVLARLWALRSVQRYLVTVRAKVAPLILELHDQIELTHHRHGLDETPLRVVSLTEDYNANQVTIGGWM